MQRITDLLIACVIFIMGLLLLSVFSTRGFYSSEAGFALFAQAMGHHGGPWISRAYPPVVDINFSTIPSLMYLSAAALGKFNAFSVAFPGMVASGLTVAFTYLLGALKSRQWGFLAALLVLATEAFFLNSRSVSLYPYLTAITTISLFCMVEFELQSLCFYPLLSILFALAFLVNGLAGVLVPALAVCIYLLFRGKFKKCGITALLAIVVGILGCIFLVWAASQEGGPHLLEHVIHGQLNSLLPNMRWHWTGGDWLSLLLYTVSLPLAILVVVVRWHELLLPNAKWEIQLLRALLVWSVAMIFFTIFWGKQPAFMLPMTPALALIGATLFTKNSEGYFIASARKVVLRLFFLVPFAALIVLIIMFSKNYLHQSGTSPYYFPTFILLALTCVLTIFFGLSKKTHSQSRAKAIILLAAAAFFVVNIGVIEPVSASHDKTDQLAKKLQVLEASHQKPLVFYNIGPGKQDMLLMLYLDDKIKPVFVKGVTAYGNQDNVYVVMSSKDYQAFPDVLRKQVRVLMHGELGRLPVVVFEKMPKNPDNKMAAKEKAPNKTVLHHPGES